MDRRLRAREVVRRELDSYTGISPGDPVVGPRRDPVDFVPAKLEKSGHDINIMLDSCRKKRKISGTESVSGTPCVRL